jgi:hypothetical protein
MKRIAAFTVLMILVTTAAATENYQDWWWNSALSGMGWNVGQQADTITVAWYLYDSTENPMFLTMAGPLVGNRVEGTLFESFGPPPGPGYNPADVEHIEVGTARLVFLDGNQATFTYDYDGLSGAINLQRYTYKMLDISGDWEVFSTQVYTGCTDPSLNGPNSGADRIWSITQIGNAITIVEDYFDGESCTYDLTGTQKGSIINASGTLSCDYGITGNVTFSNIRIIEDFLITYADMPGGHG